MKARRLHLSPVVALVVVAVAAGACQGIAATPGPTGAASASTGAAPSIGTVPSGSPVATLNPSVAPTSGGVIVFTRFEPAAGHDELYTISPDGTNLLTLLGLYPNGFALPRWNPAATMIAAVSGDKADGQPEHASDEDRGFETTIQSDRKTHTHLQPPSATIRLVCSTWTADSSHLACEGWSSSGPGKEGIYTVRASDGGDPQRLTTPPSGIRDIPGDYSADGSKLVFVRATYAVLGLGQIWMCNADGSDAHKITDTLSTYRISWSRDGRWIVGERNGALEVIDLQNLGADPRLVEIPNGKATEPRWSPDGSRIVFVFTKKGSSKPQIATVNADGSGLVLVTSGAVDGSPDWGFPGF